MFEIPLFKAEKAAGITELSSSISYAAALVEMEAASIEKLTEHVRQNPTYAKAAADDVILHHLKSILVTTGWNKNQDVFDRYETWAARRSPEDTPFNYEHDCSQIIGHITGNYVIDEAEKVVADESALDELPDKFHIVTPAVLYKFWEKADLQDRMNKVLAELREDKLFVSMECYFKGFDYALRNEAEAKVIARNDQTAFLTKHLRAYGGNGEFNGFTVGRLLRNITFSGKGLVKKPANPESIIFSEASVKFVPSNDILGYVSATTQTEKNMNEIETLKQQVAEATEKNKQLEVTVADITALKTRAEGLADELKALSEAKSKVETQIVELSKTNETLIKERDEAKAALDKIAAEKRLADRFAKVKAHLKVTDDNAEAVKKAEILVASLSELSDEKFDAILASIPMMTLPVPTNDPQNGNTNFPSTIVVKTPPKLSDAKDPRGAKAAEGADLANPQIEPAAALAVEPVDNGVENLRVSIAGLFGVKV